jgi:hypothetical protein
VHAVAVTRLRGLHTPDQGYREPPRPLQDPPRDAIVRVLAALTGTDEADWRIRVGRPLPWVISMQPDAARASALVGELRRSGLGAVTCDADDARTWTPRGRATVVLDDDEIAFVEHERRIPYAAIRAAVLATLDTETTTEQTERAGGSPRQGQPVLQVSHFHREGARSRALYLVLGSGEPSVRLDQGSVRLADPTGAITIGSAALAGTARQRFDRCVDAILLRAPDAIRDGRLLTARRNRSDYASRGDGVTHTTSNVRETELVAHLIALAWIEQQIDPAT